MPRFLALLVVLAVAGPASRARAGAALLEPGYGQFIAGIGFSEGSRRFDGGGRARPAPAYRKATAAGYLEWGWRPWLTLVAAPTLARSNGVAVNQVTGSDGSGVGARVLLARGPAAVMSLQVLVQPPLGDAVARRTGGGARALAADVRLQLGRDVALGRWPAFVEIMPGARLREAPFPDEARLDLAVGVRPLPRLLLLGQVFAGAAPSRGTLDRSGYAKLQGSVVTDITSRWSVQVGLFRTIAGRNAVREAGPLVALWIRF